MAAIIFLAKVKLIQQPSQARPLYFLAGAVRIVSLLHLAPSRFALLSDRQGLTRRSVLHRGAATFAMTWSGAAMVEVLTLIPLGDGAVLSRRPPIDR